MRFDQLSEILRLRNILIYQARILVETVGLEAHPRLQRTKSARQVHAHLAVSVRSRGNSTLERRQITRRYRKRVELSFWPPHKHTSGIEIHVEPFVKVECK